ncbi:hypothetical protein E4U03_12335 [Rothia nasimurium]|uniref:Uncharacterized protein n=1 Tax=Rothia nasimurium TaxID=85336 RepID=A0A4Y9F008_9MICC|nr:hypothetical protein [Rothia nasimurium]MBF0809384.1 hypothetical protein [Rothia nasimurium]TFU19523.1 hypothetical protein E4U03_12335 [Rothia nasimurium]
MTLVKKISTGAATAFLACGAVVGAGLATPSHAVAEGNQQSSQAVLHSFRGEIEKQVLSGDSNAKIDLDKFDSLTKEQKLELMGYLDGSVPMPSESVGNMQVDKSSGVVNSSGVAFRSVSSVKDVWATEAFTFAGIKISETKATGKYEVTGDSINTLSQGCIVERSYNPVQSINSENNGHFVSGGKAVFECKVTSVYGIPNVAEASKRENIQFIEANANGEVVGNGWR